MAALEKTVFPVVQVLQARTGFLDTQDIPVHRVSKVNQARMAYSARLDPLVTLVVPALLDPKVNLALLVTLVVQAQLGQ